MIAFELLPKLIRSCLESDRKQIEAIALMISKKIKKDYPDISQEIIRTLSYSSESSITRSINMEPIPVDKESRYELAKLKEPIDVLEPILDSNTLDTLNDFVLERESINILLNENIVPPNSILLYGKPGVGKTYTATWLASKLNLPLITLDLASSISSYLGRTGQNIHSMFEYAKSHNAVLFLDELDAIAKRRDDLGDLGELKRLVNVLLKEMEDCPYSCIIIGATNHPDLLDKAIWRRFDRTIEIQLPSDEERRKIVKRNLDKYNERVSLSALEYFIKNTNDINAADLCKICEHIKRRVVLNPEMEADLIMLDELFSLKPARTKEEKKDLCLKLKEAFSNLTQRDISRITKIPLSSVSRYLTK